MVEIENNTFFRCPYHRELITNRFPVKKISNEEYEATASYRYPS